VNWSSRALVDLAAERGRIEAFVLTREIETEFNSFLRTFTLRT
jgi:hypothetical protein